MSSFRGVGARLSLALLLVVAGALALVYLIVVPSLEKRLISAKTQELQQWAPRVAMDVAAHEYYQWQDTVDRDAPAINARIVVFDVDRRGGLALIADSAGQLGSDRVALRAAQSGRTQHGTVERGGERYADVAVPVRRSGPIVLLTASLHDSLATVDLVGHRLLLAGTLALIAAVAAGYGASRVFARRIRRLERAADRIAAGRFDEPVVDRGNDELAELAAAFERMRQRLAQLDNARREFIANASHELRTPLFALAGSVELLQEEDMDETTRSEFLVTMREQLERLTRLATVLLDLTRIDAGRLYVERVDVDLAAVAADLVDEFRGLAQSSSHELEIRREAGARALGDPDRVLQIGRILVENALRHTPSGTRVRIDADSRAGQVLLRVTDNGPGIPRGHADQIFDRFYRSDGAAASGSGLGLAIGRELAELMGGRIELESAAGRTAFSLVLPAASLDTASEVAPEPVEVS